MSSTPSGNKRRLSRRSGSPSQLASATAQPTKKIKEEIISDTEATFDGPGADLTSDQLGQSDDEDVAIPSAMSHLYASEAESQAGNDDDAGNESDGGLQALVSRARQARTDTGKWDADAKRARWNEKYGVMPLEDAVCKSVQVPGIMSLANFRLTAAMSQKWRSGAYGHFEYPKIVTDDRGDVFCRFVCKRYVHGLIFRVRL